MRYSYRVREDKIEDEEGILHTVYGIEVLDGAGRLLPAYTLPDLFCRREQAESLCQLCNQLELEPVHLFAVAEDALV